VLRGRQYIALDTRGEETYARFLFLRKYEEGRVAAEKKQRL
jgi:hypothetical protein